MFARLLKDESGMTMGLTIIMVVLIGVMGAGLLTFVATDLNTVVEVNQGRRAFEAADAGIQAAKKQLLTESSAGVSPATYHRKYDGATGDVQWSSSVSNTSCSGLGATGMCFNNLDGDGTTSDTANVTIQSENTATNTFKIISTGGYGEARRKIEAKMQPNSSVNLPFAYYSATGATCNSSSFVRAPNLDFITEGTGTFDSSCAVSLDSGNLYVGGTGTFNSSATLSDSDLYLNDSATFNSSVNVGGGNGVYVRNDATLNSSAAVDADRVYIGRDATFTSSARANNSSVYVGRNASFSSSSGLSATSLFARGNVQLNGGGSFYFAGTDSINGNWQNSYNPTARTSNLSGIGAMGTISGSSGSGAPAFRGSRSFDSTTAKRFVGSGATGTQMNFPFDPAEYTTPLDDYKNNVVPTARMTTTDIEALRQIAIQQETATGRDHYRQLTANGTHAITNSGATSWPTASSTTYGYGTVVFVRFPSSSSANRVEWRDTAAWTTCRDNPVNSNTSRRGIIVVENGNFSVGSSNGGFNGWVVVRGTPPSTGNYTADSSSCMHSVINAQGTLSTNSSTQTYAPPSTALTDLNQYRSMKVLSWRELYQ